MLINQSRFIIITVVFCVVKPIESYNLNEGRSFDHVWCAFNLYYLVVFYMSMNIVAVSLPNQKMNEWRKEGY